MSAKWTTEQIPDQSGRLAIVTGSNTGLGLEVARELARHGARVVIAVRNVDKGDEAARAIRAETPAADLEVQRLDLASLESVRRAADEIRTRHERIDLLVDNAGLMYTAADMTEDGFELQMGVNHLGHFAFTGLLLDRMLPVEGSRVVAVSSVAHRIMSDLDPTEMNRLDRYNRVAAYGRSKLANLLFTYELQRRLTTAGAPTAALASHPGVSTTELTRNSPSYLKFGEKLVRPFTQDAGMGALPILRAATDPAATGGQYYGPDGIGEIRGHPKAVKSSSRSHDRDLQTRLWEVSEELTGVSFAI